MSVLRECPFCGGTNTESRVCDYGTKERGGKPYIVGCRKCNISVTIVPSAARVLGYKTAKEAAEARWNNRPDNWISVEDRLPEDNTKVLIYRKHTWEDGYRSIGISGYLNKDFIDKGNLCIVTHWQTLPQPPRGDR